MQKLMISNLPRWISELHLKQFFNSCGKIVQANVALDKSTLRPLGHGYLTFASEEATKRALAKDGSLLDGSVISVQLASAAEAETEATEVIL